MRQVTLADELEEAPAFAPDGGSIAFTRESGGVRRIVLLDLATTAERELTHGPHDDLRPSFAPDGRSLLFMRSREAGRRLEPRDIFGSYDGADIFSLEIESGREHRLVENAANPALSPDGRTLAFDASWAGPYRLWLSDVRGRNPRQVTSDASEAVAHLRPRWSPDGRHLVFQNVERTRFDVRIVDVATQGLTWVTHDAIQDVAPTWCPTGRYVYFTSARGGGLNIWRVPVSPAGRPAGGLQQITTGAGQDVDVALSADGRRFVFSILRQNADLWRLPLDAATGVPTGAPARLIGSPREESRGAWSPDGRHVAFNSDRAGDMNLWLLEVATGALRRLTDGSGGDYQPRFSPDGRRLAFFSSCGGSADIWTLDLADSRLTRLTDGPAIDVNPTFTRDGRHIAFMSDRTGRLEVWLMGADGSDPHALTDVGVMGHFLAVPPDASGIVFRSQTGAPPVLKVPFSGAAPEPIPEVAGGAHMTLSPDGSRILDVVAHKVLWVSPLTGGAPEKVFGFDDPDVRIDYPNWSPDGRWALFDVFRPQGGNIWIMEESE
jgi:Tol biopolymer transport system component